MFKYLLVDHAVPAMCPSTEKCEIAEQFLHKDTQSSPRAHPGPVGGHPIIRKNTGQARDSLRPRRHRARLHGVVLNLPGGKRRRDLPSNLSIAKPTVKKARRREPLVSMHTCSRRFHEVHNIPKRMVQNSDRLVQNSDHWVQNSHRSVEMSGAIVEGLSNQCAYYQRHKLEALIQELRQSITIAQQQVYGRNSCQSITIRCSCYRR